MEEIIKDGENRMQKSINTLKEELKKLRTGRASPHILESIKVNYYGQEIPIIQIAGIGVPEPKMIVIKPYDKNIVSEIEKAILKSGIGLTPKVEGGIIKIPIPPLSEERRKELVKLVKKFGEESKIALRNIRRDLMEKIKQKKENGEISEDEAEILKKRIESLTEKKIGEIEEIIKIKEREIMEE
ncbi:MAG: ribosome recycling factor [Candidatus Hydrothermales bacterium]